MVDPIITIAAGMSVQSPFTRTNNRNAEMLQVIRWILNNNNNNKTDVFCLEKKSIQLKTW